MPLLLSSTGMEEDVSDRDDDELEKLVIAYYERHNDTSVMMM